MKALSALNWPARLKERFKRAVARFFNQEVLGYELKVPNDMARLYQHIRKGGRRNAAPLPDEEAYSR